MVLNDVVLCGVGSGAECCSEYDAEYMCNVCEPVSKPVPCNSMSLQ